MKTPHHKTRYPRPPRPCHRRYSGNSLPIRRALLEPLEQRMLLTASPWQNPQDPYDVNDDSVVAPSDALMVINALEQRGAGPLGVGAEGEAGTSGPIFFDVNGDGHLAPNDVLLINNRLNSPYVDTSQPHVVTSQDEYRPGDYVTVSAGGFLPGRNITFDIRDANQTAVHSWTVTDGSSLDFDGETNGSVLTQVGIANDAPAGATYTLHATGMIRWWYFALPQTATTEFRIASAEPATIRTDLFDYPTGHSGMITGENFAIGETVELQVLHTDGTPNTGYGHDPWYVTDGGDGDLDFAADGNILTRWYVAPDDSEGSTFELTATGLTSGQVATTTFIDPGGDYGLDFVASAPLTYDKTTGGGSYDDRTIGDANDVVESLQGTDFISGNIVSYLMQIDVDDLSPIDYETIEIVFEFGVRATNGSEVGHVQVVNAEINYGPIPRFDVNGDGIPDIIGDGPNEWDDGIMDDRQQQPGLDVNGVIGSSVSFTQVYDDGSIPNGSYPDANTNADDLLVTVTIDDLESSETVILRLDLLLGNGSTVGQNANIQSGVDSARVIESCQIGQTPECTAVDDTISVGNQTIPFRNAQNIVPAVKSGTKFHDLDGDGVRDAGEPGLENWEIRAYLDSDGDGLLDQDEFNRGPAAIDLTDANGDYELRFQGGDYVIVEVLQDTWFQSAPDTDVIPDGLDTSNDPVTNGPITLGQFGFAVELDPGETETGNDFGNFQQATKSGRKFTDLQADGFTGDGTNDDSDPGLGGWQIVAFADLNGNGQLDAEDVANGIVASDTTDNTTGAYELTLDPGDYIILEAAQADWFQSFPASSVNTVSTAFGEFGYAITLESGEEETGNDFGNFQQATKSGRKFTDLQADGFTGDGTNDDSDPGLGGWEIRAYADLNGNGVLDAAEITNGVIDSDTTAANTGAYELTLDPGDYIVVEVLQADYFQSFPADSVNTVDTTLGEFGYAITLESGGSETGNDFGNFQQATKSGRKFEDLQADGFTGDGTNDDSDPGLGGWQIVAFADLNGNGQLDAEDVANGIVASDTTDNTTGAYELTLDPGDYIILEATQADWFQSFPASSVNTVSTAFGEFGYAITLESGDAETGNDFGNWRQATKSGRKFTDLQADGFTGDGTNDDSDPGLGGWEIRAYADLNGNGMLDADEITNGVIDSDTTAATTGAYELTLDPGDYIVVEVLQADYFQSFPADSVNTVDSTLGEFGYAITLESGDSETGNDFGNFQQATKSGRKFTDLQADGFTGDGTNDDSDPGLGGWEIRAYADLNGNGVLDAAEITNGVIDSDTTAANTGAYELTLDPGDYIVVEVLQADYFQSFPADSVNTTDNTLGEFGYAITLESGDAESGNDFGNFQQATKSGRKFEDLQADGFTGDGTNDDSDPGLGGWEIRAYADLNGNGVLDAAEITNGVIDSDTTAANTGAYELTLDPGDYIVVEVLQADYFQSFPADSVNTVDSTLGEFGYAITLESGDAETGNDFGNWQQATKSGRKFEDLQADGFTGDGTNDDSDPGLGGWEIRAYADLNGNGVLDAAEITNGVIDSDTTAANTGAYELTLDPGDYIVVEVLQADYFQSFPADSVNTVDSTLGEFGYAITLESGDAETGNDFGNWRQATKSGRKFTDLQADGFTGDGTNDDSDPGLGGWEIRAYADLNGNGVLDADEITNGVIDSDTTAATTGAYELTLDPGDYIVVEVLQADYFQSFPADSVNTVDTTLGEFGYAITLESGDAEMGNDFGNFQQATKSGRKFTDLQADGFTGDGTNDDSDPGLGGWEIRAYADLNGNGVLDADEITNGVIDSDTTAATTGAYELTLDPGDYIVVEVLQADYFQSFPADSVNTVDSTLGEFGYAIALESGDVETGNDFGNFQNATKRGFKFRDLNEDGEWQLGDDGLPNTGDDGEEPTISDWPINLKGTDNRGNAVDLSTTTGSDGSYSFSVPPGTYTVFETLLANWTQTFPILGPDGIVTAENGTIGYEVSLASGEVDEGNNFGNFFVGGGPTPPNLTVLGAGKGVDSQPYVWVINKEQDTVVRKFLAYEASFTGGVQVATGDVNNDGSLEIVTAPGAGREPEVKVFRQDGTLLASFLAYDASLTNGVQVAVGDVNGDGDQDIAVSPYRGFVEVRVFENQLVETGNLGFQLSKAFMPFSFFFWGGAVVSIADMGTFNNGQVVDAATPDGKGEVLVGSGPSMTATVRVYDVSGTPALVRSFTPFGSFTGGVSLDTGRINGDLIPDLIVGAGPQGGSQVVLLDGLNGNQLGQFQAYSGTSANAPVNVAGQDSNNDGLIDMVITAQGPDGTQNRIKCFDITDPTSPELVDEFFANPENDEDFLGAYSVASL